MPKIRLKINGITMATSVPAHLTLVDFLRDQMGLMGTKKSCGTGNCGACTVILDGKAINSCIVLAVEANGGSLITIEGLQNKGELHCLQKAFIDFGAIQCGFCSPGMIMSAKALLDQNPHPSDEQIKEALAGNLCRCTGYAKILEAVKSVIPGRI